MAFLGSPRAKKSVVESIRNRRRTMVDLESVFTTSFVLVFFAALLADCSPRILVLSNDLFCSLRQQQSKQKNAAFL